MLNDRENKIVELIKSKGPLLPIQIKKDIGLEVYILSAILATLVNNKQIVTSNRKIGSSPVYYLVGQEERMREKLMPELNELEKRALARIKEKGIALEFDLYPQERFLLENMKDYASKFILKHNGKEISIWKHHSVPESEMNRIVEERIKELQPVEEPEKEEPVVQEKVVQEKLPAQKEIKKTAVSDFEQKIRNYLLSISAQINSSKRVKAGEHLFDISIQSPLGIQNFLLKAKDKKSLSETDIAHFMTECQTYKKQGIILMSSELNKKTQDYLKRNIGDLLKIIKI